VCQDYEIVDDATEGYANEGVFIKNREVRNKVSRTIAMNKTRSKEAIQKRFFRMLMTKVHQRNKQFVQEWKDMIKNSESLQKSRGSPSVGTGSKSDFDHLCDAFADLVLLLQKEITFSSDLNSFEQVKTKKLAIFLDTIMCDDAEKVKFCDVCEG